MDYLLKWTLDYQLKELFGLLTETWIIDKHNHLITDWIVEHFEMRILDNVTI